MRAYGAILPGATRLPAPLQGGTEGARQFVCLVRRVTGRKFILEDKVRIVLDGFSR